MIKKILSLAAAACMFLACEKVPTTIGDDSPEYSGEMTVIYEGSDFTQEDIKVSVEFDSDSTFVDIMLHKVKFVPAMPVRIDVTIMDVPAVKVSEDTWSFEADGLTPWAMGGPYDKYRIDDIRGTLTKSSLKFSLGFYNTKKAENYPTSYSGSR